MDADALQALLGAMPFAVATGIELQSAAPDAVVGSLPWATERCTADGIIHGGALMTLADTIGALAAFLNLPPGSTTATIESKTNLFRAVREGTVTATATPLHVGRTTIAVQTEVRDEAEKLVSLTVQTQAVIGPRSR